MEEQLTLNQLVAGSSPAGVMGPLEGAGFIID